MMPNKLPPDLKVVRSTGEVLINALDGFFPQGPKRKQDIDPETIGSMRLRNEHDLYVTMDRDECIRLAIAYVEANEMRLKYAQMIQEVLKTIDPASNFLSMLARRHGINLDAFGTPGFISPADVPPSA
jgi:hypothetical protein